MESSKNHHWHNAQRNYCALSASEQRAGFPAIKSMRKMGMYPPCTLQEFYKGDPKLLRPMHFMSMRGTADKIWSNDVDPYGVMRMTAEDWTDNQEGPTN
jgi:hypothetical protein